MASKTKRKVNLQDKVTLQVGNMKQEFDVDHAERVLRMPRNGGWVLPNDSEFTFDEKNGLIFKPVTASS